MRGEEDVSVIAPDEGIESATLAPICDHRPRAGVKTAAASDEETCAVEPFRKRRPTNTAEVGQTARRLVTRETFDGIDWALESIGLVLVQADASPQLRPYDLLATQTCTLHGLTHTSNFSALATAASMMHDYIDALGRGNQWDQRGLQLYFDAMRCLRGDVTTRNRQAILEGLQQLISRRQPER